MKFTKTDILILRDALDELPFWEWHIVYLRHWENFSIQEISNAMGMKWDEVDQCLQDIYQKLKARCLDDIDFSLLGSIDKDADTIKERRSA